MKQKILILLIDKHFFEQIFRKVEPEIFLYEFLNSGDPLYLDQDHLRTLQALRMKLSVYPLCKTEIKAFIHCSSEQMHQNVSGKRQ